MEGFLNLVPDLEKGILIDVAVSSVESVGLKKEICCIATNFLSFHKSVVNQVSNIGTMYAPILSGRQIVACKAAFRQRNWPNMKYYGISFDRMITKTLISRDDRAIVYG